MKIKVCIECQNASGDISNLKCHGVRNIITGEQIKLSANTARYSKELCGKSGKYYSESIVENNVRSLKAIGAKMRKSV